MCMHAMIYRWSFVIQTSRLAGMQRMIAVDKGVYMALYRADRVKVALPSNVGPT